VICNGGSWPPFQTSELARRKAFYPGDAFCDITGIDLYDYDPAVRGTFSNTGKTYRDAFNMMKAIAPSKMIALCEAEGLPDPAKCFTDPKYAPWLYCLPWFSDQYTDNTAGATRNLCEWNKVQFKSSYVLNAGDFVITSAKYALHLQENQSFSVFPNPVSDGKVTVKINSERPLEWVDVTIHDISGRIVQNTREKSSNNEIVLNVAKITPGVYFISLENNNLRMTEKLIIE
jgi:hypothetical protein